MKRSSSEVAGDKMRQTVERILEENGYLEIFRTANNFHLSVENEPFQRLVIEVYAYGGDRRFVSVAHTFVQNGDTMRDSEIVFALPTWEAVEITQDVFARYHTKYKGHAGRQLTNIMFDRNVLPLVTVWANNLRHQGYERRSCVVKSLTHPQMVAA